MLDLTGGDLPLLLVSFRRCNDEQSVPASACLVPLSLLITSSVASLTKEHIMKR